MRVTALLTCHNRRAVTLQALAAWFAQVLPGGVEVDAVLVDDGSADGTAEAVLARFPHAHVVRADGTLYWAAGMARAERVARTSSPEYFLWLNDDVLLDRTGLETLLRTSDAFSGLPHVVAGAVRDPLSGRTSYGGVRRLDWHPLRFGLVPPTDHAQIVDTVHGNVLLVPAATAALVGGIDGGFAHAYADFDYGLRLRAHHGVAVLAPGHVGTCPRNDRTAGSADLPVRERWALVADRKGMPMRSHVRYLRRHGGPTWPFVAVLPYLKAVLPRPLVGSHRRATP